MDERALDITPLLSPKPILTTHDGVEVTSNDTFVYLAYEDATNYNVSTEKDYPLQVLPVNIKTWTKPVLIFSTRELAQSYINTKWAELHPEPIFVTEDGVNVFKGDTYYYCRKSGFWGRLKAFVSRKDIAKSYSEIDDGYSYFSTPELVQAYLNKVWAEKEYNDLISKK
jgi:hypothetical protein